MCLPRSTAQLAFFAIGLPEGFLFDQANGGITGTPIGYIVNLQPAIITGRVSVIAGCHDIPCGAVIVRRAYINRSALSWEVTIRGEKQHEGQNKKPKDLDLFYREQGKGY